MKTNLRHLKPILNLKQFKIFDHLLVLLKGIEKLRPESLEKVKIETSNNFQIIANVLD